MPWTLFAWMQVRPGSLFAQLLIDVVGRQPIHMGGDHLPLQLLLHGQAAPLMRADPVVLRPSGRVGKDHAGAALLGEEARNQAGRW